MMTQLEHPDGSPLRPNSILKDRDKGKNGCNEYLERSRNIKGKESEIQNRNTRKPGRTKWPQEDVELNSVSNKCILVFNILNKSISKNIR
ncbi:unnamed protein product [Paramecium octaurelia]|uniref:Uncharacterized protein n=1 Tax=Paramecium octaurelia TaxID=43137 RepID=A0A8S1S3A2_PAROT|nr:unnamed protein product [Paramecium octaurelia]